ncbi:serine/threonine-protein kinase PINK1, mitochondrial-like [Diaphorina citri]|uniref:non-specific serine/threonine protein kinase n=1 Tax=Diaphorina citri TaxID=121845 RepID=A0A1S3DP09_DIACI|nr:serine/threonine-protein kinase PINK1, mitochondrial-like [Diaphorina citri]XP_026688308.1 serine/threonine-protein kinase PINK1, mitochondrial-like [Diaphorina citri]
MSLRTLLFRFYHNGKLLVRYIKPLQPGHKIEFLTQPPATSSGQGRLSAPAGHPIQTYFQNARKLFVNSLLNRVTNSMASDLRRKTIQQLLYKDNSKPFLAFVGVSLASGTGILTKEDEFEGVCWEIRHAVNNMFDKLVQVETLPDVDDVKVDDIQIGKFIAKGTNAVVYEATFRGVEYALKMMFNYSAASNSHAILKAMSKELLPLRKPLRLNEDMLMNSVENLPPHPNVVVMHFAFTDFVPSIPDSSLIYPSALPARLNPTGGYGRNMSLFILMKKYNTDLRNYLRERCAQLSMHERILLFTQLLEGVTHLNMHRTAHRDLKSDNILLDCSEDNTCPQLVITDFGSSYTNKSGLSMQYSSADIELGGNVALMAPEVALATPGLFSFVNYSKSDAWTAGTVAYEIFGHDNPFYQSARNTDYEVNALPQLNTNVPEVMRRLVAKLLENDPSDRPSAELAATVCQLYLWAPKHWLYGATPSHNEIMQWLLTLTTKVLCTGVSYGGHVRRTFVEYQLISTFLKRAEFRLITNALQYIQRVLTPKPLV